MENLVVTKLCRVSLIKRNKGHKVYWEDRYTSGICGVLRGRVLFKFQDREILCKKNDALFIPQGATYIIEYLEDTQSVLFNFDTLEIHNTIIKTENTNLYNHFKIIHNYFVLDDNKKQLHIFAELYKILAAFADSRHKDKYTKMVKEAEKMMVDNLDNPNFLCRNIAEHFGISEVYLTKLFKKENGIPPRKYLMEIRMNEAKSLLEEKFNVTQVAKMVGYKDVFQFSKAYKNFYGYPPVLTKFKD